MMNQDEYDFSVIIPVYNIEKYLPQCIDSVLRQKNAKFEVILVDDGSTDSSSEICDWYFKSTPNLKVIHQKNQGSSVARNQGIDNATGKFIVFLDGDDWWKSEDFLERCKKRIDEKKSDVIIFNFEKVYENGKRTLYFKKKSNMPINNLKFEWIHENKLWTACAWNKIIDRKLFRNDELRFKQNITSEDIDWCLRLALLAETYDYIEVDGVCYRQRVGSVSHSISVQSVVQLYDNIDYCVELLKINGKNPKEGFLWSYIAFYMGTLMYNIALLDDKKIKKWLIKKCYDKMYILEVAVDFRVKIFYKFAKIIGLNNAIKILQIYRNIE